MKNLTNLSLVLSVCKINKIAAKDIGIGIS